MQMFAPNIHQPSGYLGSAILALQNSEFISKSSNKKDVKTVS